MAKLVIEISDEDYNRIKDIPDAFDSLTSRAYKAIKMGTVVEEINNPCTECGANDCSRENCPNRKIYVKGE